MARQMRGIHPERPLDTIETEIDTDNRGLGDSIVTCGELYERVEHVNQELMLADAR